jgi:hypothetical protein
MNEPPQGARRPRFIPTVGVDVEIGGTGHRMFLTEWIDERVVIVAAAFIAVCGDIELLPELFLPLNYKAGGSEYEAIFEFTSQTEA